MTITKKKKKRRIFVLFISKTEFIYVKGLRFISFVYLSVLSFSFGEFVHIVCLDSEKEALKNMNSDLFSSSAIVTHSKSSFLLRM